jgi:dephospho-CoA kinase
MAYEYAIALTGSIATGKSTVASLLSLNGMRVIDADTISHEILEENSDWVRETFGNEYLMGSKVNRTKLGEYIFSHPDAKKNSRRFLTP